MMRAPQTSAALGRNLQKYVREIRRSGEVDLTGFDA
jgi:hypothetical protein